VQEAEPVPARSDEQAAASQQAPTQQAPAQPAPRGRRKRARVVAPAGPPGGSTATPVGEFADQGDDHVV
jgi:ribonuclease E